MSEPGKRATMKKPKFRKGQVVYLRADKTYFKIGPRSLQGCWYYWKSDSNSVGFGEGELRPLTLAERGERRRA